MKLRLSLFLALLSSLAFGTATVTGKVSTPATAVASGSNFVTFELQGCGNNPAHATQGGEAATLTSSARFPLDASGNIVAADGVSAATIVRNDQISCGGVTTSTFYLVTIFINNSPISGQPQKYRITDGAFNLNSALPITTNPVVVPPTGDSTYLRLDSANRTKTQYAEMFAGADIGTSINGCLLALVASGGTCDARQFTGPYTNATNPFAGVATTKAITLLLGAVTINDSSCWIFPNDGISLPAQGPIRILGAGYDAASITTGKSPVSGTIINNSCNTGVAKFDTRGAGVMEVSGITFQDSTGDSLPFWQTTNTILLFHDNQCYGSKNGVLNNQDCIVLGSSTMNLDSSSTAAFQGYHSYIEHNFFNHIRRAVYGKTFANNVFVKENTIWVQSGSNLVGGAAIEFAAIGGQTNTGNVVRDNLIEVTNYPYGVKFSLNGFNNTIAGNGCYDPSGTHISCTRFENTSQFNLVEDGYRNDSYGGISEDAGSLGTNTFISSHQNQFSSFTGPVRFINTGAGSPVASVRQEATSVNSPMYNARINTTNDEFYWGISTAGQPSFNLWLYPAGGAGQEMAQFKRYSSTQVGLQLDGSLENFVESLGDLKLRASGGTSNVAWIGTTAALKNFVGDDGVWHNTVATGTAPLVFASTTPVANLTLQRHPTFYTCGSTLACGNSQFTTGGMIVIGQATLTSATPSTATVTGISPAFSGAGSYFCFLTNTTTAANGVKPTNVSGSSFTITGPNTVTDVINYACIGN